MRLVFSVILSNPSIGCHDANTTGATFFEKCYHPTAVARDASTSRAKGASPIEMIR